MDMVQTRGLVKAFGHTQAIDNLDLEFEENRLTGLIGRNGSGKTTLLKLIAGYYRPSDGIVSVFGENPFKSLTVSSQLIFVDDNMQFPPTMSLREILVEMKRFYVHFDAELAEKLLNYFGIDLRTRTAKLSKGMRSTFFAVLGIAARTPLTLFDEPTTGMDAAVRKDFYRLLLKEYIAHPRTIILSSHLLGELSNLLEQIVLLDRGRLVKKLSADEAETYAVGLRGATANIEKMVGSAEILHHEELSPGIVYVAVKAPLRDEQTLLARELGLELLPVHADDLCIYLTENGKGGIDHVIRG